MILCREELAKDVNRAIFPGQQGGPLMHVDRRQGRRTSDRREPSRSALVSVRRSPTPRRSPRS